MIGTRRKIELSHARHDVIRMEHVREQLNENKSKLNVRVPKKDLTFTASHALTPRLVEILFSGGLTNWIRNEPRVKPD
jgi:hypothetical protein